MKYEIKIDTIPYFHPNGDDLLAWYEGTTHGVIRRSDFSETQISQLRQKYPKELYLDWPTLRLIGYKPE